MSRASDTDFCDHALFWQRASSSFVDRCRAKNEQIGQSGPESGPGFGHFQVNVLEVVTRLSPDVKRGLCHFCAQSGDGVNLARRRRRRGLGRRGEGERAREARERGDRQQVTSPSSERERVSEPGRARMRRRRCGGASRREIDNRLRALRSRRPHTLGHVGVCDRLALNLAASVGA